MKFLDGWLRKWFVKKEVKQGKILVLWRDVDDTMHGWTVSADNEYRLNVIAKIIDRTKVMKLRRLVTAQKKGEDSQTAIFPMDKLTEEP